MIAKAKAIAHGVVSLNYITRKGDAPVVKLNHLPSDATPQAIWARMRLKQMLREQELHVMSNFEPSFFGKGKSTDFRKVKSTP